MALACVYCGGRHDTSSEVRDCWSRSQEGQQPKAVEEPQLQLLDTPRPVATSTPDAVSGRAAPGLGRNVVVRPGRPSPDGWTS
ncbi:MAG TPA: hypothetical protein VHQ23_03810, partial [Ilumatobacteraceae bacterium]|nr:hypothetical protein [Ilumatobacteraceae bacterium]